MKKSILAMMALAIAAVPLTFAVEANAAPKADPPAKTQKKSTAKKGTKKAKKGTTSASHAVASKPASSGSK